LAVDYDTFGISAKISLGVIRQLRDNIFFNNKTKRHV